ncbi:MAG: DUF3667 domain-containing protein [Bernardetiaceae bacterium]
MPDTPTHCLNCDTPLAGRYCHQCGQSRRVQPIGMRYLAYEITHLINLDRGIPHTFLQLTLRPGHAIRAYIAGHRKRYFNPIKYLLLVSAIAAFIHLFIPYDEIFDFSQSPVSVEFEKELEAAQGREKEKMQQLALESAKFREMAVQLITLTFNQYFSLIMLLSIPILSVFTRLFFYRHAYNYAMHFVLNCYLIGHTLWFYVLLLPFALLGWLHFTFVSQVYFVLYMGHSIWAYIQFFAPRYRVWAGLKALFMILIFSTLFFFALAVALVLYYVQQNEIPYLLQD